MDNFKLIPLSGKYGQGKFAKVDSEDYDELSKSTWCVFVVDGLYYAKAQKRPKQLLMHRVVMKAGKGEIIDHINHDTLDNRKANLRFCTSRQNSQNQRKRADRKYKGVIRASHSWRVYIEVNKDSLAVEGFKTELEAAQAYDSMAKYYFGEFALPNFPSQNIEPKPFAYWKGMLKKNKGSQFLGVYKNKRGRFTAGIVKDGKNIYGGTFETEYEAARKRDELVKQYGVKAKLNFPK